MNVAVTVLSSIASTTPCRKPQNSRLALRCQKFQNKLLKQAPSRDYQRRLDCIVRASYGPEAGSGLPPELKEALETFVTENKIVAFIKGTKQFPQCGFSNTVVQIFNQLEVPYITVNVLEDDRIRVGMKEYSQWPTFPQIYIDGEFFGGCDIALEAYQSGELQEVVERALNS